MSIVYRVAAISLLLAINKPLFVHFNIDDGRVKGEVNAACLAVSIPDSKTTWSEYSSVVHPYNSYYVCAIQHLNNAYCHSLYTLTNLNLTKAIEESERIDSKDFESIASSNSNAARYRQEKYVCS
jgi:hypothetical protein